MAENKEHQGGPVNQGFNFGEKTKFGDGSTFNNYAGAKNVIINHFGDKNTTKKSQPRQRAKIPSKRHKESRA